MEFKFDKTFFIIMTIALIMLGGSLYYNHLSNQKISLNNDQISDLKKIHEEEIKSLNASLIEEKRKNDEALKLLKSQIEIIDKFYQKKLEDLEKSKDVKKAQLSKNSTLDSLANDLLQVIK